MVSSYTYILSKYIVRKHNVPKIVNTYTKFQNSTKTPLGDKSILICQILHGKTLGTIERESSTVLMLARPLVQFNRDILIK